MCINCHTYYICSVCNRYVCESCSGEWVECKFCQKLCCSYEFEEEDSESEFFDVCKICVKKLKK